MINELRRQKAFMENYLNEQKREIENLRLHQKEQVIVEVPCDHPEKFRICFDDLEDKF